MAGMYLIQTVVVLRHYRTPLTSSPHHDLSIPWFMYRPDAQQNTMLQHSAWFQVTSDCATSGQNSEQARRQGDSSVFSRLRIRVYHISFVR